MRAPAVVLRALRTLQGDSVPVFSFFVRGRDIVRLADINRLERNERGLQGFQRGSIAKHVKAIADYLDSGKVLFPNAIILALSARVRFVRARGTKPDGVYEAAEIGTLYLPIDDTGPRAGWIVDGQQRSLALARCRNSDIPVPVVAFACDELDVHREQFILVNRARPLPARLVDELLPEVGGYIPRDLSLNQLPSALVNMLNSATASPFLNLIRRQSTKGVASAVVTDRALVSAIRKRIHSPLGALASFKPSDDGAIDVEGMLNALMIFWRAVRETFPKAWGLPPEKSRLMHGVGIEAMSALMDRLMIRAVTSSQPEQYLREALRAIAPACAWTAGRWPDLGLAWNELENTPKAIRLLTEQLVRLDFGTTIRQVA
jgi:DGQHR domain-containing protein